MPDHPHLDPLAPYDAVLLVGFGGPESETEVMPFLRRVTAGRDVPEDRLAEVAEHYYHFGGRSPINDQNRALRNALKTQIAARGSDLDVVWGNRNSEPFLADAVREARERGWIRLCAVLTSAYSSYSSCRQYREDLAAAVDSLDLGGAHVTIDKVRPYALHPGFVETNAELLAEAVRRAQSADEDFAASTTRVLYVTHSIPEAMDDTSGPGDGEGNLYVDQHLRAGRAISDAATARTGVDLEHELVFCSRSGSPRTPWLEPDINDRITELAGEGVRSVIVAPIGFVSDHMEVINDLDREAKESAEQVGVAFHRVATAGTHPRFVAALVDLLEERASEARGESTAYAQVDQGDLRPPICAPGCCPNLREARPA